LNKIPHVLTTEDEETYKTLINGYNELRHQQRWPKISVDDLLEWENYKKYVIEKISSKIKENK
jgi:hypothetical protein